VEPPVAGPRLDVKTSVFEGPLELLLALAEREEVDIFQVSLSRVTDAYLAEIAARDVADPQEMAEFLWMAARLLLLKSIRLLPGEPPTEEETDLLGWEEEVRKRLEEYRAYKQMAEGLMERRRRSRFRRPPGRSKRQARRSRWRSVCSWWLSTACWHASRRGPSWSQVAHGRWRRSSTSSLTDSAKDRSSFSS
jgi:chromatin segregation and condensation protein Rec8/ScpA/Scc1 (kleisin family)